MKHCSGQIKYLIAIKELSKKNEYVKCVDISNYLNVSRPCVSKTLRCLANSGYVNEDFCNGVELTREGKAKVNEILNNFDEVYIFFHKFLRLSADEAHEQALTFVMSFPDNTCERLKNVVKNTMKNKKKS